ncbi:hypothetical protein R69658_07295 [Paraburkholderia aspalathi]|uniref:Ferritin-like diiron domain-containing protein n=1 Tax=Paraburkholderia aspalathi TaxID=1324617 RepID=A0ABN7NC06_9BURK|nr:hypothetical protein R69658_07295 [Paraburkholderia aspalathi]
MAKVSGAQSAASQSSGSFVMDIKKIREDARKHMSDGPVTQSYGADRETVLKLLNDSLATEIVCVLRYKRHHFMAKGINSEGVAAEFAAHAAEEQEHADRIAERIVQLGGEPDFAPEGLKTRSHSEYKEGSNHDGHDSRKPDCRAYCDRYVSRDCALSRREGRDDAPAV